MSSYEDNPDNFDGMVFLIGIVLIERYTTPPPTKSNKYIVAKTLGIVFFIFIICSAIISGYHAWNEFPSDSVWIKLVRVWIAIIFAPFYIFYIFIKTTVFKDV